MSEDSWDQFLSGDSSMSSEWVGAHIVHTVLDARRTEKWWVHHETGARTKSGTFIDPSGDYRRQPITWIARRVEDAKEAIT